MILEDFILVGFLHGFLILHFLFVTGCLIGFVLISLCEPSLQIQRFSGNKLCFSAIQNGNLNIALCVLLSLRLDKVDGRISHEIRYKQVIGSTVNGQWRLILL